MANSRVDGAATQKGALSSNTIAVLGVFGPSDDLRALMRLSSGRIKKVRPGSRVGSGKVAAIEPTGVMLRQSGQIRRVEIPGE